MINAVVTASATGNHPGFSRTPSPLNTSIIHSGNSLTDAGFLGGTFPDAGINALVNQYAGSSVAGNEKSTIPGSSMSFRWSNATAAPDAKTDVANYAVLVMTDVSTSFNTNTFPATQEALPSDAYLWANHAWTSGNAGAGAEMLLWCPWARTDVADIQAQYERRFYLWALMQDYCNARRPAGKKPVRLIPGSWLWYEFWKDQQNGVAPSVTWYDDLYEDEVHQYQLGAYISQVLHAACIYGIDPQLLPSSVSNIQAPTTPELAYIRAKIKQVVTAVKRSGVDTTSWA